jgi:lipid II:glycine glycyltransferase (peptidoglycan interpeptide bridge formation enzyme)
MHIAVINPDQDPRWNAFVEHHKESGLFHDASWARVLRKAFGYQPLYFAMVNQSGNITSAIPTALIKSFITGTRLVSLPFADHCDPLVANKEEFNTLIQHILKFSKQSNFKSVVFKTNKGAAFFEDENTCRTDSYIVHHLSLSCPSRLNLDCGPDDLFRSFHKGQIQRNIKKALASDLRVSEAKTENDLKAFYHLLLVTRKKRGLPPHPYSFFQALWNTPIQNRRMTILIARKEDRPVAGIMLARYKHTMHYLYAGSNPNFLKDRPNHLLLWLGIKKAFSEGMRVFDFGRTSLDNEGLLDFKRRWATTETEIHYFDDCKKDAQPCLIQFKSNLPSVLKNAVRRTPSTFLKFGSSFIYRHLGS